MLNLCYSVALLKQHKEAAEALRLAESSMLPVREAEVTLFGFGDNEIGFHLLRQWQLSEFHQESIRHSAAGDESFALSPILRSNSYVGSSA